MNWVDFGFRVFHKYIAFYAYINCCKTNSSLKRGNEKVAISNINTIISNDIQKVWNIVLAVDKYNSWRSDLSKTEIINDKQFIEYTKNGYATTLSQEKKLSFSPATLL